MAFCVQKQKTGSTSWSTYSLTSCSSTVMLDSWFVPFRGSYCKEETFIYGDWTYSVRKQPTVPQWKTKKYEYLVGLIRLRMQTWKKSLFSCSLFLVMAISIFHSATWWFAHITFLILPKNYSHITIMASVIPLWLTLWFGNNF